MIIKNLPNDLNSDILLKYLPPKTFEVIFRGLHNRNLYKDILGIDFEEKKIFLGRNSMYNTLPEFMFHSVDRFKKLMGNEQKEEFSDEYTKQEKEKEDAYKFFLPVDLILLQIRIDILCYLDKYTDKNKILIDIITDNLTKEQKENRFIKKALPYLTFCKDIRGDITILTFILRKILKEEGLNVLSLKKNITHKDINPRYGNKIGDSLNNIYLNNDFYETTFTYNIKIWPDNICEKEFFLFISEIEEFRIFFQDFFLSIDSVLTFDITKDSPSLRLSDTNNYLNYNINI